MKMTKTLRDDNVIEIGYQKIYFLIFQIINYRIIFFLFFRFLDCFTYLYYYKILASIINTYIESA